MKRAHLVGLLQNFSSLDEEDAGAAVDELIERKTDPNFEPSQYLMELGVDIDVLFDFMAALKGEK